MCVHVAMYWSHGLSPSASSVACTETRRGTSPPLCLITHHSTSSLMRSSIPAASPGGSTQGTKDESPVPRCIRSRCLKADEGLMLCCASKTTLSLTSHLHSCPACHDILLGRIAKALRQCDQGCGRDGHDGRLMAMHSLTGPCHRGMKFSIIQHRTM
jgi:ribosomal protein L37AE/L43A